MKKSLSVLLAILMLLASVQIGGLSALAEEGIDNAEALVLGEEKEYHFTYGEWEASPRCWFTFTPEKDGTYQFNFTNKNTKKVWQFNTRMYDSKKNAKNDVYVEHDGNCYFSGKEYADINPHFYTYTLKKGVTYYLDVYIFAADEIKEADVPVVVTSHTHKFKEFFQQPVADEPGAPEEGEYGKICKTCGYETDIHVYKRPAKAKLSKLTKGKKSFKATWKKVKGVTGYQFQYSTSSKFTKKTAKTVNITKQSTTSRTVKKLKGKKKYYVRIRTYKTVKGHKVYSKWSTKKTVTTKK